MKRSGTGVEALETGSETYNVIIGIYEISSPVKKLRAVS